MVGRGASCWGGAERDSVGGDAEGAWYAVGKVQSIRIGCETKEASGDGRLTGGPRVEVHVA